MLRRQKRLVLSEGGDDRRGNRFPFVAETISGCIAIAQRRDFAKLVDRLENGDILILTTPEQRDCDAIEVSSTVKVRAEMGMHYLAAHRFVFNRNSLVTMAHYRSHMAKSAFGVERKRVFALLTGGVTLARAVTDPGMSERIAKLVAHEALRVADGK